MRMRIAVCGRQLRELPCHGPCHLRRRFRISEFDSSSRAAVGCSTVSSQGAAADPPHATTVRFCALLKTGANMVSRTKERAREPLLVLPALPALVAQSTCWLRSAATARLQGSDVLAQHPCSSTAYARHYRLLFLEPQSIALKYQICRSACAKPTAQSPDGARTCVSYSVG